MFFKAEPKSKPLEEPLLGSHNVAIDIHYKTLIIDDLKKIKKKLIDATLNKHCKNKKSVLDASFLPCICCSGFIALAYYIVNTFVTADQSWKRYNKEILYQNSTCSDALELNFEWACGLMENTDQQSFPALEACRRVMEEMCKVDFYTYVLMIITVLIGCAALVSIGVTCVRRVDSFFFLSSLNDEESRLVTNLNFYLRDSEKENLKVIDKYIAVFENAPIIPLPDDLLNIIDSYFSPHEITARIVVNAPRM